MPPAASRNVVGVSDLIALIKALRAGPPLGRQNGPASSYQHIQLATAFFHGLGGRLLEAARPRPELWDEELLRDIVSGWKLFLFTETRNPQVASPENPRSPPALLR